MKNAKTLLTVVAVIILSGCASNPYGGDSITILDDKTKSGIINTCGFIRADPEYDPDVQDETCREKRYVEHIEDKMAQKDRAHEIVATAADTAGQIVADGVLLGLDNHLNKEIDDDYNKDDEEDLSFDSTE